MAYTETTCVPTDGATGVVITGDLDFTLNYDEIYNPYDYDVWWRRPILYVDNIPMGYCQLDHTNNRVTISLDTSHLYGQDTHTWRIMIYNQLTDVYVYGTTKTFTTLPNELPGTAHIILGLDGTTDVLLGAKLDWSSDGHVVIFFGDWFRYHWGKIGGSMSTYDAPVYPNAGWNTRHAPGFSGNTTYQYYVEQISGGGGGIPAGDVKNSSIWGGVDYGTFQTGGLPAKAIIDAPSDAGTGILLGLSHIQWFDGGGADDFNVWFGPSGNMSLIESGLVATRLATPIVLSHNTTYQWRIDANNVNGTTTGDTWSFTTLIFYPPVPSGEVSGAGGEHGGEGGKNNMVTVKRIVAAANNTIFYEDA